MPPPRARPITHVNPGKSKKSPLTAALAPTSERVAQPCGVAPRSVYLVARTEMPGAHRSATTMAVLPFLTMVRPGAGLVTCDHATPGDKKSTVVAIDPRIFMRKRG